jgi:hypothetical protein
VTKPKWRQPTPMELAQLAIQLRQSKSIPVYNVRLAREYYIEALICCRESASLSLEEYITNHRNAQQVALEETIKAEELRLQDTLELDPQKQSDAARDYLGEHGLHLKTADKVLEHVRNGSKWADTVIGKEISKGEPIYSVPRFLLEAAIARHEHKRKRSREKSRAKEKRKSVK